MYLYIHSLIAFDVYFSFCLASSSIIWSAAKEATTTKIVYIYKNSKLNANITRVYILLHRFDIT